MNKPLLHAFRYVSALTIALCLSACATNSNTIVRSTASIDMPSYRTFMIRPKNESSLEALQFSDRLRSRLEQQGYIHLNDPGRADLAVVFDYMVGQSSVDRRYYTSTEYGMVGGGTSDFRGTASGPGGTVSVSGSIYDQPRSQPIGTRLHSTTVFQMPVSLRIEAADWQAYNRRKQVRTVCKMHIVCVARTSDTKAIVAGMIDAAAPYFGRDLPKQVYVTSR